MSTIRQRDLIGGRPGKLVEIGGSYADVQRHRSERDVSSVAIVIGEGTGSRGQTENERVEWKRVRDRELE